MTGPDGRGDGDGWVDCDLGHRHWGLFGAAGLLLHRRSSGGATEVLLQHRATWSHHGGTWGLLGGARHSDESAVSAALREAGEEGGLAAEGVRVHGRYDDAHGGWAYTTVLARTEGSPEARPTGGESLDVGWFGIEALGELPLHPGFASSWPKLRSALAPLHIVVDAANVIGSRPDGWWRDRAGAAGRLVEACAGLVAGGIGGIGGIDGMGGIGLPAGPAVAPLTRWWPEIVVVVEGAAARSVRAGDTPWAAASGVEVAAAVGSGDDEVVAAVQRAPHSPVLVVTADRGLRARIEALGAFSVGPRWLNRLIDTNSA